MEEIRCKKCGKLLGKIDNEKINILFSAAIPHLPKEVYLELVEKAHNIMEIKCPRCGEMNTNKGECQE